MVVEERNVALAIVLSLVTCGIYGLYWVYKMTEEMKTASGDESLNGVMAVLLPLVTCNIYGLYWSYKVGKDVPVAKAKVGLTGEDKAILFLVLDLLGLGIVTYALVQCELNDVANAHKA
jgi:hypothetical protein